MSAEDTELTWTVGIKVRMMASVSMGTQVMMVMMVMMVVMVMVWW